MTMQQRMLVGLGAIVLLILVLELVRRRKLREEYTIFWLVTCVVLLVLAIWKGALELVARVVGTTLPLSALFGVGFFLALLIMLHFSMVISGLWRQNKQMAKEIALFEEMIRELQRREESERSPELARNDPQRIAASGDDASFDFEPSLRG
jgi:hypothetical protein